jgi:hypothetical protein
MRYEYGCILEGGGTRTGRMVQFYDNREKVSSMGQVDDRFIVRLEIPARVGSYSWSYQDGKCPH